MNTAKTKDDRSELIPLAPPVYTFTTTALSKSMTESAARYLRSNANHQSFFYGLIFQMDLDSVDYSRQVYTYFNVVADIGGFFCICYLVGAVLAFLLLSFNKPDSLLISRLFKRRVKKQSNSNLTTVQMAQQELRSRGPVTRMYCLTCRDKPTQRGYYRALRDLHSELDFENYFRRMKQFESALTVLLTKKERYLLRN